MCHYNLQKRIASAADYTSRLQGFRGLEFRSSEDIKCPQQTLLLSRLDVTTQQMQLCLTFKV